MAQESMKDFEHELNASMKNIEEGDIIMGTIIGISDDEVTVDLDYYAPGIVGRDDMSNDPGFSPTSEFKYGQRVKAKVQRLDDGRGNLVLSFKEAENELSWEYLRNRMEKHEIFTVRIRESVKGGIVAYVEGVRGFIPASQITNGYVEDLSGMVGKELPVVVTEVNEERSRLVLSGRAVAEEREREEREHRVAMLIPGDIVTGRVESIMPYGAFVDIGDGLSGLVHISRIATRRIKSVEEVLKVGDEVRAKIINTDDGKISLSIRAVEEEEAPAKEAAENERRAKDIEKYSDKSEASTSLGDLLKGIKL